MPNQLERENAEGFMTPKFIIHQKIAVKIRQITLLQISIFCSKIQLSFPEKNDDFLGVKNS